MHIFIEIEAGDPKLNQVQTTGHCIAVFVACDEKGNPVAIPTWKPGSEADLALEQCAIEANLAAQSLDARLRQALASA
jgi:acyl-CoA hydrolase